MIVREKKKKIHVNFLNMYISVNMAHTPFKFETCILEIQMEGSLSQNFDLGNSFHFIICRTLD